MSARQSRNSIAQPLKYFDILTFEKLNWKHSSPFSLVKRVGLQANKMEPTPPSYPQRIPMFHSWAPLKQYPSILPVFLQHLLHSMSKTITNLTGICMGPRIKKPTTVSHKGIMIQIPCLFIRSRMYAQVIAKINAQRDGGPVRSWAVMATNPMLFRIIGFNEIMF